MHNKEHDSEREKQSGSEQLNKTGTESSSNSQERSVASVHRAVGNRAVANMYKKYGEKSSSPEKRASTEAGIEVAKREERRKEAYEVEGEVATEIEQAKGNGESLKGDVRREMERRFGTTLGDVNVHRGSKADSLARRVDSEAFATGRDIFFRTNNYGPESTHGKSLLAHELAHVVSGGSLSQHERDPTGAERESDGFSDAEEKMPIERSVQVTYNADLDDPADEFWEDVATRGIEGMMEFCDEWASGVDLFASDVSLASSDQSAGGLFADVVKEVIGVLPGGDLPSSLYDVIRKTTGFVEANRGGGDKSVSALVSDQKTEAFETKDELGKLANKISKGASLASVEGPEYTVDYLLQAQTAREADTVSDGPDTELRKVFRDKQDSFLNKLPTEEQVRRQCIESYLDGQRAGAIRHPGHIQHQIWWNPGEGEDNSLIGLLDEAEWETSNPTWWGPIGDAAGIKESLANAFSPTKYLHNVGCIGMKLEVKVEGVGTVNFRKPPDTTGWMTGWEVEEGTTVTGAKTNVQGKSISEVKQAVDSAPSDVKPQIKDISV